MKLCLFPRMLLLLVVPVVVAGYESGQSTSTKDQGLPAASSMTIEQCVAWLQKNLVGPGKQRVVLHSGGSACDVTFTSVAFDLGELTLGYIEGCKVLSESWTQKATFHIPLADVYPRKLSVVELEPGKPEVPNGAFILHVVMFEGKKTRTHRTWAQDGKSETKDFNHNEQELYFGSKEKAYQTVDVLRRMASLVSGKKNENR